MNRTEGISVAVIGRPKAGWAGRKALAESGFNVLANHTRKALARADVILAEPKAWCRAKQRSDFKRGLGIPVILVGNRDKLAAEGSPALADAQMTVGPDAPSYLAAAIIHNAGSLCRARRETQDLERHVDNLTDAARQLTESLEKTYTALILSQRINTENLEKLSFQHLGSEFLHIFDCCAWGIAYREDKILHVQVFVVRRMRDTTVKNVVRSIRGQFARHTGESLSAVKTKASVYAKNCHKAPGKHKRGLLTIPMAVGGHVKGAVFLFSRTVEEYTFREAELFGMLANQIAAVLENTRLYGEVKRLSITDDLTGHHNRRHLAAVLNAECFRAKRMKSPLSVMLLDIDNFKKINDTLGHTAGDVLLKALADLIKRSIRRTDTIGRWGGEEFLYILPGTDIDGALKLAEKVRRSVENHRFIYSGTTIKMTASIGVTGFDAAQDEDCQGTIKRVDDLLYFAKSAGRNCVKSL